MKIVFLSTVMVFCLAASAQSLNNEKEGILEKLQQDSVFRKKLLDERSKRDRQNGVLRLPRNRVPNRSLTPRTDTGLYMPNLKLKTEGTYLGNNRKGSDLYKMSPDNMICLVPDSTFKSSMPVSNRIGKGLKLSKKNEVKPAEK